MKFQACIVLFPLLAGAAKTNISELSEIMQQFMDDISSDIGNIRGSHVENKFLERETKIGEMMKQINDDTTKIVQAKEEDITLGSSEAMKSFKDMDYPENKLLDWDDCPQSAPFIITNHIVEVGSGNRKYMYLWDDDKTPNERWKFLYNFDFVDRYFADYVWLKEMSADEALTMLHDAFMKSGKKKIMFYTHGWNAAVEDAWCSGKHLKEGSDYFGIPIIWRTDRGYAYAADYRYDRVHTAPNAGIQLSSLFDSFFAEIKQPKSWMCHSMGCYVTQVFATEISEDGAFQEKTMFDDVFLVAPDIRYDIFNEWPHGSGKDKNECRVGEWNDPDDSHRIPDCRLGGGNALVDMSKRKVQVHWNPSDEAGGAREFRLRADLSHTWPISFRGLLNKGDDTSIGARLPKPMFADNVTFVKHTEFGSSHDYQFSNEMLDIYDEYAN